MAGSPKRKIQLRRGDSSQWVSANPVLSQGEPGYDTTTGALKVGDGLNAWTDLAGLGGGDFQTVGPFDLLEGGGTLTGFPRHVAVSGSEGDLPGPVSVTMPSAPADPDGAWTVSYDAFDDALLDELDVVGALNLLAIPRGYTAVLAPVPGVGWFCDGLFPTATVPTGGGALDAKAPATRTVGTGLGTSGTVNLDMASLHGTIQTITLSGNPTFTTLNRAAGREVTLVLAAGGSTRTITWPSWIAVGAALPTSLASGKTLVATVTFVDTTDAAAIAAAAVQP